MSVTVVLKGFALFACCAVLLVLWLGAMGGAA